MRRGAVEPERASRYRRRMPNRKTFDPREKYDHSGRPVEHAQANDLKADISEEASAPPARAGVPIRPIRRTSTQRRGTKPFIGP
jgi:hypothetical protein